jgi:hypothetical protein
LTRTDQSDGFEVVQSSADTTTPTLHRERWRLDDHTHREVVAPDGLKSQSDAFADDTQVTTAADGTVTSVTMLPDPYQPYLVPTRTVTRLPSGLERVITHNRSSVHAEVLNPRSATLSMRRETRVGTDPPTVSSYTFATRQWVAAVRVNGVDTATYRYDRDGLITSAGALALQRSAQTGSLIGTTLGSVSTTRAVDRFNETSATTASFGTDALYTTSITTRDRAGRVVQSQEAFPREGMSRSIGYTYDAAGFIVSDLHRASLSRRRMRAAAAKRTCAADFRVEFNDLAPRFETLGLSGWARDRLVAHVDQEVGLRCTGRRLRSEASKACRISHRHLR